MTDIVSKTLENGDTEFTIPVEIPAGAILHVTVAGELDYTDEDMSALADMFQKAALDPSGAVIVTRAGVSAKFVEA